MIGSAHLEWQGWRTKSFPMSDDRQKYAQTLDKRFEGGTLTTLDVMKAKAEFEALVATKRMPLYSLLSTIAAAISAIASAAAAYFAYLGLHH
jgi:hypothetical protein